MSASPSSNPRSPTPTPAVPFPSTSQEGTLQRTQASRARTESSALRPILPAAAPNLGSSSRGQSRPIQLIDNDGPDSHMAKRIRISDDTTEFEIQQGPMEHRHDSLSTSSNTTAQDEQPITVPNPLPKKKRTRTLTTPHQAAVLHELLARSRFPTTAMREEVGRSIGLSARKVQNQRQKLRRPRSQSEANTNRLQYGAFPSVPPPAGAHASFSTRPEENSFPLMSPASRSSQTLRCTSTSVSTPESYSSLSDTPSQLLGPGVPGLELHPRVGALLRTSSSSVSLPQIGHFDANYSAAGASHMVHYNPPPASPTRAPALPRPLSFPSHFSDAYRTLPPLAPGSQTRAGIFQSGAPAQPPAGQQQYPIGAVAQPITIDHPFIHYTPVPPRATVTPVMSASGSAGPSSIPPPFTLQPSPQWDNRSFAPLLARRSMWSPPSSSGGSASPTPSISVPSTLPPLSSSVSTPSMSRAADEDRDSIREGAHRGAQSDRSQAPPPQPRIGRYDPVRATFIPLTGLPPPHQSPPFPPSDADHTEGSG
ncbi:hypothetical protein AX15_007322 [Amanita polypyramis BW_CC]|nr:hypothetical protein AX15_007322 [Amanita polypyramis BW_CC]